MGKNYDKMVKCSQERSKEKYDEVMNCLTDLLRKGEKVSVHKLHKLTGISATTIYKYEDVVSLIDKQKGKPRKKIKQSEDSKDAIIKMKNAQISSLTKALADAEKDLGYKEKYLNALEEIKVLKKRIEDMLSDGW